MPSASFTSLALALAALAAGGCGPAADPRPSAGRPAPSAATPPVASAPPADAANEAREDEPPCAEPRPAPPMHGARMGHHALRMADGRVMVVGGSGPGRVETFDPRTERWHVAADLPNDLYDYDLALTNLADGSVLAAGRLASGAGRALRYEPAADRWQRVAPPAVARGIGQTLTLLDDGTVLLVGGSTPPKGQSGLPTYVDTAERYDPKANAWRAAGKLEPGRVNHAAVKLNDGSALIVGGATVNKAQRYTESVALYEPATNAFRPLEPARTAETMQGALLEDGRVLLVTSRGKSVDFLQALQIFDPTTRSWRYQCRVRLDDSMPRPLAILPGNMVLAVAVRDRQTKIELISLRGKGVDPGAVADLARDLEACPVRSVSAPPGFSPAMMTATVLADGRVLFAGGQDVRPPPSPQARGDTGFAVTASNQAWLLGPCRP